MDREGFGKRGADGSKIITMIPRKAEMSWNLILLGLFVTLAIWPWSAVLLAAFDDTLQECSKICSRGLFNSFLDLFSFFFLRASNASLYEDIVTGRLGSCIL